MSSYVPAPLRRAVAQRADFLCEYCLISENDTYAGCQVEHIIAEKHGGETHESNLAYACAFCNRAKGSDIASLVGATRSLSRLFSPRTDVWSHHFRLSGVRIEGISDIGICTVALLNFNHDSRIEERAVLVQLGRYPPAAAHQRLHARPSASNN